MCHLILGDTKGFLNMFVRKKKLPLNKEVYTQTMLMARHQKIAKLFDEDFWDFEELAAIATANTKRLFWKIK